MRCSGLSLTPLPFTGSEPRFFYFPTRTQIPTQTHISFFVTSKPGSLKAKAKATINDDFVTEEAATASAAAAALSFYDLLGIPESGSLLEIKQAYKQLARKYHPDVSPPGRIEEYTQRFIRVQEAYETLSDPRRRALYDRDMAKGLHFAFSARRRYQNDEGMEERGEWKNIWKSQLSGLKRRSMNKDAGENLSWGARMRRRREEMMN
uniref:J domain-containing protein n=1 Tax=Fagus sylvatica TaxID=28930 RepID=A0A2N9F9W6_FAGSY